MRPRTGLLGILSVLLVSLLSSCGPGGVTFKSVEVNRPLPDDFKNRTLYANTDILKYRLSQLAGSILLQDPGATKYRRVGRVLPAGVEPEETQIPEDQGELYRSVVDRGAAAEGSYLAFTAKLSATEVAQVWIRDRGLAFVAFTPGLHAAISQWVKENPKVDASTKRYYVQGALLASVTADYYQRIEASASGVVGNTLGAKGNVFNEWKERSNDFRISLELLDLDEWARAGPEISLQSLIARAGPPGGQTIDFP